MEGKFFTICKLIFRRFLQKYIKPFSVILSEAKNLMLTRCYETLHFVQGDIFRTFARAS